MKKYIAGVVTGILLSCTAVLAVSYTASPNTFPVQLNGKNVSIEGYNIEGSAYFKLRDIADAVGDFDVDFKNDAILISKDGYDYSAKYIDVTGRTVADIAAEEGLELADFLKEYGLPSDLPADTSESETYNTIPCGVMARRHETTFEDIKKEFDFPDEVTEDTPWGEAIDGVTLGNYIGEEQLDDFKQYYGFGDEVTADTLWSEVRRTVDEKSREERIQAEKSFNK